MLDELKAKGYELSFSCASHVTAWGKWFVGLKRPSGHAVNGYGDDEASAFADALKTVLAYEAQPQSSETHK